VNRATRTLIAGFGVSVFLLLLLSSFPVVATVSVTIINESNYPWLVQGAYANYIGESGGYIMPNGTLLLDLASGPPSLFHNTTLDWTVLNRTGDMAWFHMQYRASGCDVSQEEYAEAAKSGFTSMRCTNFEFNTTQTLEVNVATGEAYNGSQPIGLLNFWAPPLISSATVDGGTAFVDGARQDVLSNVTGPFTTHSSNCSTANPCSSLGGPTGSQLTINESGAAYAGPFTYYTLMPMNIGRGSNRTVGWLKVYGFSNSDNFIPMPSPLGYYNYYSGLALTMSQPEYPVQTWVCGDSGGYAANCEFTTYSTTLGTLFRSEGGFPLFLASTNIPIKPSQTPTSQSSTQSSTSQGSSGFPLTTWEVVGIVSAVVVIAAASAVAYRLRMRGQRPQR
jgi:hypothetical protein